MMGRREDSQVQFLYAFDLDKVVPADHLVRQIDAILDLSWVHRELRPYYSHTGRPSIDPVVFFRLQLILFFEGLRSERQLMGVVSDRLSLRWYLGYDFDEALPDHSSLTRSRQRLGEVTIRRMFEYVLQLCIDAGLVGGDLQSVDSTFVQANASLSSLRPRLVVVEAQRFTERIFKLNVLQDGQQQEEEGQPQPPGKSPGLKTTRGRPKKPPAHESLVSRTDPEATLYHRRGKGTRVGYLVQVAVDSSKQIITGVLTTGAHQRDTAQIVPLIDQVIKQGVDVKAVAADRGYSAGEVLYELGQRDVQAYIPQPRKGGEVYGHFGQDRFLYDPESDRYQCPQGAWLRRNKSSGPERRYKARKADCRACPLREQCTSAKVRTLNISPYHTELVAASERQKTPAARRAARLRRVCSERSFAEAKERHGLRRAQRRGLKNMAVQALLTATVMNLKRYVKAQTRAFTQAAAARQRWPSRHLRLASAFLVTRPTPGHRSPHARHHRQRHFSTASSACRVR